MNPEFWNIFPVSSRGFSGRILVEIVSIPIGSKFLILVTQKALGEH
jgi:hypothetical protein